MQSTDASPIIMSSPNVSKLKSNRINNLKDSSYFNSHFCEIKNQQMCSKFQLLSSVKAHSITAVTILWGLLQLGSTSKPQWLWVVGKRMLFFVFFPYHSWKHFKLYSILSAISPLWEHSSAQVALLSVQ